MKTRIPHFKTRRGDTAAWSPEDVAIVCRARSAVLSSMLLDERQDDSMGDLCTVESQFLLPMRRIEWRDGITA